MSKLTKRYAKEHGVPLSKMVEGYLASEAEPSTRSTADTPVLRSVRGILDKANLEDYKRHLANKHLLTNKSR